MRRISAAMLMRDHEARIVRITLLILVLAGALYSFHLGTVLRYPDERDYMTLAQNLAEKGIFSLDGSQSTAYRPPGYPGFLTPFLFLGLNVLVMRMTNFLVLAGCFFLLFRILKCIDDTSLASLGVVLALCYPAAFYSAGTLLPQTIGTAFLLLSVVLALAPIGVTVRGAFLLGIVMGLAILNIPAFIFSALIFSLWIAYRSLKSRPLAKVAAIGLGLALIVGPWTLRNHHLLGQFVLVSTNGGVNLLYGNSDQAVAESGATLDLSRYWAHVEGLNEAQKDSAYAAIAVQYMKEHPAQTARLYLAKLVHFFAFRDTVATSSESDALAFVVMLVTYAPLLIVLAWRLVLFRSRRFRPAEILLLSLYFGNAFFHALFFTRIRFRIPFDFLLIATVSLFLSDLLMDRERKSRQDRAVV